MKEDLSRAIKKFPVLTWLSEHTRIRQRENVNVYANCPICKGTWTLGVHVEKRIFHCFKCNEGGKGGSQWNGRASLVTMIRLLERCSFHEAVKLIYKLSGLGDIVFSQLGQREVPKELLPEGHYRPILSSDAGRKLAKWLDQRGVLHLFDECYLTNTKYQGRVILPCYYFGELIGFEAKSYTNQTPKSLFPDWMDTYSYFYTTDGKLEREFLVITESVLDAETLSMYTIGLYGSSLKEGQLARLIKLKEQGLKELYWMLDEDAMVKQLKIILTQTGQAFRNKICVLPKGEDPNSYGSMNCFNAVSGAIAVEDEWQLLQLLAERTFQ